MLRESGLAVLPGQIRPREGRAWLVDWHGTPGVLRQVPALTPGPLVDDAVWRHAFLARGLAGLSDLASERVVIHGDFTNDNVIARGSPPRAAGSR